MSARKRQVHVTQATLAPEKAYAAIEKQLSLLQDLKGRNYIEAKAAEDEWEHLTQSIIERAFGNPSSNLDKLNHAHWAGTHRIIPFRGGIPHGRFQNNFNARIQAYESLLKSLLAELKLDLPEDEIKGVYAPGDGYTFYRDVKKILGLGRTKILVVDPYLNTDLFDLYADAIDDVVSFRLLTKNPPASVVTVARKYAIRGNFAFRDSHRVHDRVILVDDRVWTVGQSLKDAAKNQPTYISEHDDPIQMWEVFDDIWLTATPLI